MSMERMFCIKLSLLGSNYQLVILYFKVDTKIKVKSLGKTKVSFML